jgi:hypothetical protein
MVKSIEKVFTFFVVIILILVLLGFLGPLIANSVLPASKGVGEVFDNIWIGVKHIIYTSSGEHGATG